MVEAERYAVVSCHVERPLDDQVWGRFSRLQAQRPSGFRIAALLRPPDAEAGEDPERWLARAREAGARGPLGHHTHWGGPGQARPESGDPAERVRREGRWLAEAGLVPTVFCGGGWYFDRSVAEAVGELGYADCTGRPARPAYLGEGAAWLEAAEPCWLEIDGNRLLELPTTHSVGALARSILPTRGLSRFVHAYFHDTDLLDGRRARALRTALALLSWRRQPSDLDAAVAAAPTSALRVRPVSAR
jgi:hypothetical protein